jgi:aminopeptidase N
MEHWGLITFRESNMIVDPKKSSAANQQRVGQVVAHELAHMWFGNLGKSKSHYDQAHHKLLLFYVH